MDEKLEVDLLPKRDLVDYDLERTYFAVSKFIKEYKRLRCKSFGEPQLEITTKYKYIFVDERTKGINDYTKIDEFIDSDTEYKRISKKIVFATDNMTTEEAVYYTLCLYHGKSEYRCTKEIGCSADGLLPIKRSCIVKFACAFDIEVMKDDGFADPDIEDEFQEFINEFKITI